MLAGLVLAVVIGIMSGLGAVVFRWLIRAFQTFFFEGGSHFLSFMGDYYIILIPAAGGLLIGPLVYYFAREARGHGVPEVMEAVALRGGRIRPRVALVKVMASSLCIGSGGSVGREGPIVQIGATVGSALGQWLKLTEETVRVMVAFLALKVIATSFTLGSGGSGGIFAPSLFIGAMLGTAVGGVFGNLFPSLTAPAGAYGIVGMAAVFSGAARAPFSAILIIFELTGNYSIILPLMAAVVISTLVSRTLGRESIYTLKLLRRGVDLEQEELGDVLRTTTVKEAMTRDYPTLTASMTIPRIIKQFQQTGHRGFPVLDENGNLIGVLTETKIARNLEASAADKKLTAGDIVEKNPLVAYPDQTLDRMLEAIEESEARIPVVSRDNQKQLLGVVGRHELISAYRKKARKRLPPRVRR
ncbi:MAG: chloride channel protein [Chloroflexota bacterium]